MESNLTASDVLNMARGGGDSGIGGIGLLILLFFFTMGGNFSGRGGDASMDLQRDILNGHKSIEETILTSSCANKSATDQARYDTLLGFKEQQAQFATCCCENKLMISEQTNALAKAIHDEGEATRALITANTIQDLRDSVAGYRETLSNANQTQNILNSIGRFVVNPATPWPFQGTTIA